VLEEMLEQNTRLTMQQVVAQVESEHGMLTFENEVPFSSDSMFFVTEENGSELASYGGDITLFGSVPVEPGVFRRAQGTTETWLLLDSDVLSVGSFRLRVRVASSCELSDHVLSTLLRIFLIGIPVALLISLLGGRRIARRSLRPIRQIVDSANRIREGDLSARVPAPLAKDELGEMTETLNRMLQSVEAAFLRETRFTSDASHELRTPVAVLRAYVENLLADPSATEEQKASLRTMLAECGRMQRLIDQLLAITRGQEGRYSLCMETLSLREVVDGVAEVLADRLNEKRIALSIDVPEALTVLADQSLMTEMMLNLTENAVRYGKPGGHIAIRATTEEGKTHLFVSDDGIGIPEEALPHVFERFYRVDPARDRSGTGLGLSIVDWIVKVHHGAISARSRVGEGTTFEVTL
jgi:signal transduction histidine kinase